MTPYDLWLQQHFKKEDSIFIELCNSNPYGDCNGCKYRYICESLLPKKEVIENELSIQKENEQSNNKNGARTKTKTIKIS